MALAGRRMMGGGAPMMGAPAGTMGDLMGAGQPPTMAAPMASVGDPQDHALRLDGATRMAGGQVDDNALSLSDMPGAHSANAVNVAVGEALTRMGGGYTTNPNPMKPRDSNMRQLMQLGLSETEARLLVQTGGV